MNRLSVILIPACATALCLLAGADAAAPGWDEPVGSDRPSGHYVPTTTSAPAAVQKSYTHGLELLAAGKIIEARAELSRALLSGELSAKDQAGAVAELTKLAQATIFSATFVEGDPCVFAYTVKSGDRLARIAAGAEVSVPHGVLADINGIDGNRLRPGMRLKLIRGPFRVLVTKRDCVADVYLRQADEMIFLRRIKVAVGRNGSTPAGLWRVAGKAVRATWNPPPSMAEEIAGSVKWGQKDYPLGKDGIFIALAGIDDRTRGQKGFGLHGTSDPASLGHARSHGCVRVGDDDIRFLYESLYEGQSTVTIRE